MQERKSNAQRRDETRTALLAAARQLFVENGFADTSTPDIVAKAGVTRGALYHHFEDKLAMFRALVEQEAAAIAAEVAGGSMVSADPMQALLLGARTWFAAMDDPARVRLMLIDGPSVLGVEEMRRIDLANGGQELRIGLRDALGGVLPEEEIMARADLVSAMFDRAALAHVHGAPIQPYQRSLEALLFAVVANPKTRRPR